MALIETRNLTQRYDGRTVLSDVNLSIERGEVFGLIGPTGAGKTTLLRLLDLLDRPASGHVLFDGCDVTSAESVRFASRRRMSFVQQKPVVFHMSVRENVACGLKWRGEKMAVIHRKVNEALGLVGLADCEARDAGKLSGGEVQRVAIARALVTEPEVLFLDEPTANLDPVSLARTEEVLMGIVRRRETTVLMATHDMSQGQRLAGRIGVLIRGSLLQVGTPRDVFCAPRNGEIAALVGFENILYGEIVKKEGALAIVEVNGMRVQVISDLGVGEEVGALIRPENITFTLTKEPSSARNIFPGRIARMTELGSLVRIEVDCGFPLLGMITVKSARELGFEIGKSVCANFKATSIHLIGKGA